MELPFSIQKICQELIKNEDFLTSLGNKLIANTKQHKNQQSLDNIIQQISYYLDALIQKKLQFQMAALIQDNNRILQQIKLNLDKKDSKSYEAAIFDTSFTQVHNIINEQKKKAFDRLTDADIQKSISYIERYEDTIDKVNELQKKVRTLQDRYQTNFKSLWNVLSMTEAAVFDHIKQNKQKIVRKQEQKQHMNKQSSFLTSFWK